MSAGSSTTVIDSAIKLSSGKSGSISRNKAKINASSTATGTRGFTYMMRRSSSFCAGDIYIESSSVTALGRSSITLAGVGGANGGTTYLRAGVTIAPSSGSNTPSSSRYSTATSSISETIKTSSAGSSGTSGNTGMIEGEQLK